MFSTFRKDSKTSISEESCSKQRGAGCGILIGIDKKIRPRSNNKFEARCHFRQFPDRALGKKNPDGIRVGCGVCAVHEVVVECKYGKRCCDAFRLSYFLLIQRMLKVDVFGISGLALCIMC